MAREEIVFTSGALLDLLSQIDELADKSIALGTADGEVPELYIDNTTYRLSNAGIEDVQVDSSAVRDVASLSREVLDEVDSRQEPLVEDGDAENPRLTKRQRKSQVESGIIKQAVKTLLIGGLVRLTSKLLK